MLPTIGIIVSIVSRVMHAIIGIRAYQFRYNTANGILDEISEFSIPFLRSYTYFSSAQFSSALVFCLVLLHVIDHLLSLLLAQPALIIGDSDLFLIICSSQILSGDVQAAIGTLILGMALGAGGMPESVNFRSKFLSLVTVLSTSRT